MMDKSELENDLKPAAPRRKRSIIGSIRRFKRDDGGVASVEFAMIAVPFFLIIFGIFEVGLRYTADRVLSQAVDRAARQIRTGQIRPRESPTPGVPQTIVNDDGDEIPNPDYDPGYSLEQFREDLCPQGTVVRALFDCQKMVIDVKEIVTYTDESPEYDEENSTLKSDDFGFAPGGRSTINVVRVYYKWPAIIDFAGLSAANPFPGARIKEFGKGAGTIIGAAAAFTNEPFNGSSSGVGG